MGVAGDIVRAWLSPRAMMARRLQAGLREDRALIYLVTACLLIFLAQWPRLWRDTLADPMVPFEARIGAAMLGWIFIAPLALYGIAALSHLAARLIGGRGSWFSARLALFWSLLVAAPLWLLNGVVASFARSGPIPTAIGGIALLMFFAVWMASLFEAETKGMEP